MIITMEHENDVNSNCNCCARYSPRRIVAGTEELWRRGWLETIQSAALLRIES